MQRSRISYRPMFGTTRRRSVTTTGRSDRVESFRPLCYHTYRLWASEPVFWMSNGDRGVAPLRAFRCQYDAHRTAAISVEHSDTYMSTFTRPALIGVTVTTHNPAGRYPGDGSGSQLVQSHLITILNAEVTGTRGRLTQRWPRSTGSAEDSGTHSAPRTLPCRPRHWLSCGRKHRCREGSAAFACHWRRQKCS